MKNKIFAGAGILAVFILLYLFLWPVSIDPAVWTPPEAPSLTGVYEQNNLLAAVERLGVGAGRGPEDVAIDREGRLYAGMEDGRILRLLPDGGQAELFAYTGGRPLGMHFDKVGNLVVCDADRGLLLVSPDGSITVLTAEADSLPFRFTDDVDIAGDGTIYFSDASSKFSFSDHRADLMEHRPNGRLLAYDPKTMTTRVALDQLYFANGVAVSPEQSFVLVVETGKYRIRRLWIQGPQQGESDIFIENLPGFPDGISSDGKGTFWLALVSPRLEDVDAMLAKPFLRKVIMRLPEFMLPKPENHGFVLGLNMEGRVVHNLQDPSGSFAQISSVEAHEGWLYLGSLVEDAIGRIAAPKAVSGTH